MKLDQALAQKIPVEGEETKPPRYTIRTADFALSDLPPLEYIVEGIIPKQSVGLFYGDPGAKKTYSLVHLAVCVALNKSWLGFHVDGCKVLIIDEESGELRLGRRIGMTLRAEFGNAQTPVEFVSLANFKLDRKDDLPEVHDLILMSGAGLVIIDALADVMDGDENSKQDTHPVFTALRRMSESTGATIVPIHHSNKAGGYRGSSAIKGALDFMFKVQSDDESDYVKFTGEKARDGKKSTFTALANWGTDSFGNSQFWLSPIDGSGPKPKLNTGQEYVLRYLTKAGGSYMDGIRNNADTCSPATAERETYRLANMGLITRNNPGEHKSFWVVVNNDE